MEPEEFEKRYKVMERELSKFPKSELLNFLIVKELVEDDSDKDLWWAVDKDGTGHLFDRLPERKGGVWSSGCTENVVTIGDILNSYYEKDLSWADEPVRVRIKF